MIKFVPLKINFSFSEGRQQKAVQPVPAHRWRACAEARGYCGCRQLKCKNNFHQLKNQGNPNNNPHKKPNYVGQQLTYVSESELIKK